jgi:hypothetical protein
MRSYLSSAIDDHGPKVLEIEWNNITLPDNVTGRFPGHMPNRRHIKALGFETTSPRSPSRFAKCIRVPVQKSCQDLLFYPPAPHRTRHFRARVIRASVPCSSVFVPRRPLAGSMLSFEIDRMPRFNSAPCLWSRPARDRTHPSPPARLVP